MLSTKIPVLIAGAGSAGHVLALVLLQNGIPVRLIERDSHFRIGQKGAGIQPRTIELHRILGTYDEFNKRAGPMPIVRLYHKGDVSLKPVKERYMAEIRDATPSVPMPSPRLLGQDSHEALLRAQIERLGGTVELSTSLVSFEPFDDHVLAHLVRTASDGTVAEETVDCQFLVGTEGAHSIVRKNSGMTFLGESMPTTTLVIGDIHVKRGLPRDAWHRWPTMPGLPESLSLRPAGINSDVFNFAIVGFEGKDYTNLVKSREALVKAFYETSGLSEEIVEFGDVIWSGLYSPHIRMVDRFQVGRVLVAGDAAHVHSPTGGQGLNSGFSDSMNLGWKLALEVKVLASQTLLSSYTAERLPVIASMLEKTKELAVQNFASSSSPANLDKAFTRGHELLQFGVNYRGSKVVVDDSPEATDDEIIDPYRSGEDGQVRAGDRAPDAPDLLDSEGHGFCIYDLLKATHHTLLVFSSDVTIVKRTLDVVKHKGTLFKKVVVLPKGCKANELGAVTNADHVLEDSNGHAFEGYKMHGKTSVIVVIRPDGWIGARVAGEASLMKYLTAVFSV